MKLGRNLLETDAHLGGTRVVTKKQKGRLLSKKGYKR